MSVDTKKAEIILRKKLRHDRQWWFLAVVIYRATGEHVILKSEALDEGLGEDSLANLFYKLSCQAKKLRKWLEGDGYVVEFTAKEVSVRLASELAAAQKCVSQ